MTIFLRVCTGGFLLRMRKLGFGEKMLKLNFQFKIEEHILLEDRTDRAKGVFQERAYSRFFTVSNFKKSLLSELLTTYLMWSGSAIFMSCCLVSCTPYIVYPKNQSSADAPLSASGLGWIEASPTNNFTVTASWAPSSSSNLGQQTIQFFKDESCLVPFGHPRNLQAFTHTQTLTGMNGGTYTYTYVVTSIDTAGNMLASNCSTAITIDDLTSASNSSFAAFPASIPADGTAVSAITVTILDASSNPINGKIVSLDSSRGNIDTITNLSAQTDFNGRASFTLKSSRIGLPTLTATVSSDHVTLSQLGHVTLLAAGATPQTDYQAWLANAGLAVGSNSIPTSSFKNLTQLADTENGTLHDFGYSISSGWQGDGGLLTSGFMGPYRLVFNGISNYLTLGSSINSNPSFSFETWIRPQSPATNDSVILSTVDSSNKGFSLSQLSDASGKVSLAPAGVISVYSQAVLADNPLIYWKLDEPSGTTAADTSGNGNSGTYYPGSSSITYGQPSLTTGSGTSTIFPGVGGATLYSNRSFTNPENFSLEIWFKTTSQSPGKLIGFGDQQTGSSAYNDRDIIMNGSGTIYNRDFTTASSYNDGKIHHLVEVSSSTTGTSLYIDNILIGTDLAQNGWGNYSGFWRVGGDQYASGNLWYFSGSIDEVAIYPLPLSAARIQAHYLAGTKNCISLTPLAENAWNHLAGVFDSFANTASLYSNGNLQCTIPLSGTDYSGSGSNLTAGSSLSQTNFWSGAIANIRTYAQALTNSLVRQNYAATAAQFDIKQLGVPQPIIWLRADSIQNLADGASVVVWPDSSVNGNNATQTTLANQPVWKNNILNRYPVVRFNGTSSYMNGPNVFPTSADYSIIIVQIVRASTGYQSFIGANGNTHVFWLFNDLFPIFYQSGNFSDHSSQILISNVGTLLSAIYANGSGSVNYYTNSQFTGTGVTSNLNMDPTIQIGAANSGNFFSGDMAEILIFGSALSTNDRSLIETYLNAKYGIY